jgi:hypothetical protein
LRPALTPDETRELESSHGKWPDYPRVIVKLAKAKNKAVPGMMLPPSDLWEKARAALPEVSDRTLYQFALTELTPAELRRLRPSQHDPGSRERPREEFFRRHPGTLKRWQQQEWPGAGLLSN